LSAGDTGYRLAEVDEVLGCYRAWLCRQLNAVRPSLNATRSGTFRHVRVATNHGRTYMYR